MIPTKAPRVPFKLMPFQQSYIMLYEFCFVIIASLFANLLTAQTTQIISRDWLLREVALFYASWNCFQIYRKLNETWQGVQSQNDAIQAYRGEFDDQELNDLMLRFFLVLVFILEAFCAGISTIIC